MEDLIWKPLIHGEPDLLTNNKDFADLLISDFNRRYDAVPIEAVADAAGTDSVPADTITSSSPTCDNGSYIRYKTNDLKLYSICECATHIWV
ncbi:hypothetical protein N0V91_007205 [Didymella pomorum]|uniref:Uncharacterized protein n=1 Tax=Didymella pomorum TaxID=749634 RepID=A0A9W8Z9K9_9PLEO|nr:hypothetical protein N0V91_007205 [Didymella pomorum]